MEEKQEGQAGPGSGGFESGPQFVQSNMTVEDVAKLCMDKSMGYVACIGILTNERDERGHNLIRNFYIRHNFSLEDTKLSIGYFIQEHQKDMIRLQQENGYGQ